MGPWPRLFDFPVERDAGHAMAATPRARVFPGIASSGERGKILIRGPHALLQKKLLESEGVATVESRVKLDAALVETARPKSSAQNQTQDPSKRRRSAVVLQHFTLKRCTLAQDA